MKKIVWLSLIAMCFPLVGIAQSVDDDLYYTPKKEKVSSGQLETGRSVRENDGPTSVYVSPGTTVVVKDRKGNMRDVDEYNRRFTSRDNDFTINNDTLVIEEKSPDERGGWVNGFDGTEDDYEYATRIIRFRNPRYAIPVSSPLYWDIVYGPNSWDWNVYDDGFYAYAFPTFSNSLWWDWRFGSFGMSFGWGGYYYPSYYGWGGYYPGYWGGYWGPSWGWGRPHHHGWYDPWYGGHSWGWNRPVYYDRRPTNLSNGRPGVSSGSRPISGTRPSSSSRPTTTTSRPSSGRVVGTRVPTTNSRPGRNESLRPGTTVNGRPGTVTTRPSGTGNIRPGNTVTTRPSGTSTITRPGSNVSTRPSGTGTTRPSGTTTTRPSTQYTRPSSSQGSTSGYSRPSSTQRSTGYTPSRSSTNTYNRGSSSTYNRSSSSSSNRSSYSAPSRSSSSSGSYSGGSRSSGGSSRSGGGRR